MRTAIVVDDEPIVRLDLVQMLEENGIKVVGQASDGFDAVEICRQTSPDIVLMDIKMPIFDGLGAAETILKEGHSSCVVIISAFFDSCFVEKAKKIGVTGYLIKPIESPRLFAALEVAFAQSKRLSKEKEKTKEFQKKLEQSKTIELAKRLISKDQNISESEAYRMMQQTAMRKRCSINDIAEQLLNQNSSKKIVDEAKEFLMKKDNLSEQSAYKRMKRSAEKHGVSMEVIASRIIAKYKEI